MLPFCAPHEAVFDTRAVVAAASADDGDDDDDDDGGRGGGGGGGFCRKQLWLAAFLKPGLRALMHKAELEGLHTMLLEKELRCVVALEDVELPLFSLG